MKYWIILPLSALSWDLKVPYVRMLHQVQQAGYHCFNFVLHFISFIFFQYLQLSSTCSVVKSIAFQSGMELNKSIKNIKLNYKYFSYLRKSAYFPPQ